MRHVNINHPQEHLISTYLISVNQESLLKIKSGHNKIQKAERKHERIPDTLNNYVSDFVNGYGIYKCYAKCVHYNHATGSIKNCPPTLAVYKLFSIFFVFVSCKVSLVQSRRSHQPHSQQQFVAVSVNTPKQYRFTFK